ncbi:MAG TPA: hypothetical protein VG929_11240 [Actinomycetota bacterium]|nr:hypothetical protein [Actinomycetota bacterium]
MRNRRLVPLAIVALLLGAACGSPPAADADPLQAITAASAQTNEAGTARVEMQMEVEAAGQSMAIAGEGAMDMDAQIAHMTMSMDSDDPAMPMADMGEIEMVTDGLKVYTKYPAEVMASLPGNKPWALIDMQALGESQGMDYAAMAQTSGSDPSQMLQYLNGVSGDVKTVGQEEVRGVTATRYKATIDLAKVPAQAPADVREAVRASIKAMQEQIGKADFPVEVWIGDDGFLRRMRMSMQSDGGTQGAFSMTMRLDMYDFGEAVTVEVPAASEVTDLTEMMIGQGAGAAP